MKHSDADNPKVWMSFRTFSCCVWTPWKATAADQSMRVGEEGWNEDKSGSQMSYVNEPWLGGKKPQDDGLNNFFFNLSIIWYQEWLSSGRWEGSLFCLGWCLPAYITLFLSAGDLMSPSVGDLTVWGELWSKTSSHGCSCSNSRGLCLCAAAWPTLLRVLWILSLSRCFNSRYVTHTGTSTDSALTAPFHYLFFQTD